jgi:RNA polymerase sigma-B factor
LRAAALRCVRATYPPRPDPRLRPANFRRFSRGADPAGTPRRVPQVGGLTIMTMLVETTMTIAGLTDRTEPAASHLRQRPLTVHRAVPSRRSQPVDAAVSTEELLCQRNRLPDEHPDRAKLRAQAIEQNLPMAGQLARRYAGRGELRDDLAQVAAVALIKAVDRYDPSRQVPFAGFAIPSILGALKRHFRDTAWAMRVPRSIQQLALSVPAAADEVGQQRGRTPTTVELADYLQVTANDVLAALGAWQNYRLPSLNTPHPDTGADLVEVIGGIDPRYAGVDDHLSLQPLFAELPRREQRILTMRFYEQMTQTQIAAEIGLSQMHVSRLLRQTLARLRAAMPG